MRFSLPSVKCLAAPPSFRLLFRCLNCTQRFDYRALGSSRKLGGAAEHLIESRSNITALYIYILYMTVIAI